MLLGRPFGVPLRLSPSWFVLAIVVTLLYGDAVAFRCPELTAVAAYAVGFGFVVSLAVSVLLHELGHALTYRRYGIGVRAITLDIYGGFTEPEREEPRPSVEAIVALAGPAVSGVLGGIGVLLIWVVPTTTVAAELAFVFAVSNIIVAIFNALPGLPLDGGRALRALVWAATKDPHLGSRIAGWIGRAVAVGLVAFTVLAWASGVIGPFGLIFSGMVAMMLWFGASHAIRAGAAGARLRTMSVRRLTRPAVWVPRQTSLAEALRRGEQVAPGADLAIVVVDTADRPIAVVHDEAAAAVPDERRPWVSVESVARTLSAGSRMPADLSGEAVLDAVRANPATEYLVLSDEEVIGVLRRDDLARHLMSRGSA
ncbi:MAG: peptidase M50 [Micromonosporaceae bacterium]|nr:peptidase M50 [Micromonosporaceae bacterium]